MVEFLFSSWLLTFSHGNLTKFKHNAFIKIKKQTNKQNKQTNKKKGKDKSKRNLIFNRCVHVCLK